MSIFAIFAYNSAYNQFHVQITVNCVAGNRRGRILSDIAYRQHNITNLSIVHSTPFMYWYMWTHAFTPIFYYIEFYNKILQIILHFAVGMYAKCYKPTHFTFHSLDFSITELLGHFFFHFTFLIYCKKKIISVLNSMRDFHFINNMHSVWMPVFKFHSHLQNGKFYAFQRAGNGSFGGWQSSLMDLARIMLYRFVRG